MQETMTLSIPGFGEYEIASIAHGTDEMGNPVDVQIIATKEVVIDLLSKGIIGNYNEDAVTDANGNVYWETLSQRFPTFFVRNSNCRFYPICSHPLWNNVIQSEV